MNKNIGMLTFTNSDARPKVVSVLTDLDGIANIMAWYGAYFAGDRYRVCFNGDVIAKDKNGEPIEGDGK